MWVEHSRVNSATFTVLKNQTNDQKQDKTEK